MKRKLAGLVVLPAVTLLVVGIVCQRSAPIAGYQQTKRSQLVGMPIASARVANGRVPDAPGTQADVDVIPGDGVSDPSARRQAAERLDQTIQQYRTTMQYPLWSRPADESTDHRTHWNRAVSIGQPFAVDAAKREIAASASIDRVFVAPGDAITLQLAGSYVDDGTPARLDQVHAQLQWHDRASGAWTAVEEVAMQAGAGGWTGSVRPSQVAALQTPREVRLTGFVQLGEFSRELALDFAYTVSPPVMVHGIASERVADGQLALGLDVDVTSLGTIGLSATLFASDGTTAIAVYDDRYFPAHTGRQVIPVTFFGKILHDRKIDGPYQLGAIHGYVYHRDMPDMLFDRPAAPPLVTLAHRAAEFSPVSYHDDVVDARLAQYQAMRDALDDNPSPRSSSAP